MKEEAQAEVCNSTIKINCTENFTSKYICLTTTSGKEIRSGVYLNLFYENIDEIEDDSKNYSILAIESTKDFQNNFNLPHDPNNMLEFLAKRKDIFLYRIVKINKHIKEFLYKNIDISFLYELQNQGISFFVQINPKVNNFYLAFISSYLISIIDQSALKLFIEFLHFMKTSENAYSFKKHCNEEVYISIKILAEILRISELTTKKENVYAAFYLFWNLHDQFRRSLIKIFKEIEYKFAKVNPDYEYKGKKLKDIILESNQNYIQFIKAIRQNEDNIKNQEIIQFILPIIFGVDLKIYSFKSGKQSIWNTFEYSGKSTTFNNASLNVPNLSSSTLLLLSYDEHYDILLPGANNKFKDLKTFGSKYLKNFEILFLRKSIKNKLEFSEFFQYQLKDEENKQPIDFLKTIKIEESIIEESKESKNIVRNNINMEKDIDLHYKESKLNLDNQNLEIRIEGNDPNGTTKILLNNNNYKSNETKRINPLTTDQNLQEPLIDKNQNELEEDYKRNNIPQNYKNNFKEDEEKIVQFPDNPNGNEFALTCKCKIVDRLEYFINLIKANSNASLNENILNKGFICPKCFHINSKK